VSGLARGIDTAAHRSTLAAGGRTLAVLGSGIDVVYPPENAPLARTIERRGAVVSQFPAGMPALPGHFPARNRTLAGLALGVVVVEAAEKSGALITAGFAGDLGRETFAVAGRITSPSSAGTNRLIQDGAKLVTCWQDIVSELPEPWRRAVRGPLASKDESPQPEIGSDEGRMFRLLTPDEAQHIEVLIARAGMDPARAATALMTLELGGWARQLTGQRWVSVDTRVRRGEVATKRALVSAESPTKGKTVQQSRDSRSGVKGSRAHVRVLPKPKLGGDPKKSFKPQSGVAPAKKKVLDALKKAAERADTLYVATAPD